LNNLIIVLITIYQKTISPFKGFKCSHNLLNRNGSCSEAIKEIILEKGIRSGWPDIKDRFAACRMACHQLKDGNYPYHRSDIACDCAFSGCEPPGFDACSNVDGLSFCDFPFDMSRRTLIRVLIVLFLFSIVVGYLYHGRGVELVRLSFIPEERGLLSRVIERNTPDLRILLIEDGVKYYSEIIKVEDREREYVFRFNDSPLGAVESLKVLDGRINIASDRLVLSQVLDSVQDPDTKGVGKRFSYEIKRRWHF
jgi:putative component of membrane protein insertase Oxa1/YidC/SpoIIIJ protein YidD